MVVGPAKCTCTIACCHPHMLSLRSYGRHSLLTTLPFALPLSASLHSIWYFFRDWCSFITLLVATFHLSHACAPGTLHSLMVYHTQPQMPHYFFFLARTTYRPYTLPAGPLEPSIVDLLTRWPFRRCVGTLFVSLLHGLARDAGLVTYLVCT